MSTGNPVKHLLQTLSHGVYVIGVADGEAVNAFTASAVMQVSLQPLMFALAINPWHASYPMLRAAGAFSVTVLRHGQSEVARIFGTHSARCSDKLAEVAWHPAASGAPVLDAGLAYFDCRVVSGFPAGDHELVVAEVTAGDFLQSGAPPLRYEELGDMDGGGSLLPERLGGKVPEG
ncbi:MAG TPA: flavin reductase family protein [Thiobacillaceae bacterium]|nr:flavin reductase family protein [Thiobacillaceae bacterium]